MNTLIYPDASLTGFPKFNSSLLGAFVVQIRREEKAETEARSQTPASRPLKFRHLAKHSSLFLVTPTAKAEDKGRSGTKLFCRWSNRHPSPSGWEGGRKPGEGAAVAGCCLA